MWYDTDFNRLALHLLLTKKRTPENSAFAQVMLRPLVNSHIDWKQWREQNIYQLQHTGQVCYLRKSLNDSFDPTERRIYIGNGNLNSKTYLYTDAEDKDIYTSTIAENTALVLHTMAETADTGYDFIVYVPEEVYNKDLDALRAHIDFYKKGSKLYTIMIIS